MDIKQSTENTAGRQPIITHIFFIAREAYDLTEMEFDAGKVPDDFPEMKCISHIFSKGGKPYRSYYKAQEVWKWFKKHGYLRENTNRTPKG